MGQRAIALAGVAFRYDLSGKANGISMLVRHANPQPGWPDEVYKPTF